MRIEQSESGGCLVCVGIVVVSIGFGCLWGSAVGWVAFGAILLTLGILSAIRF